MRDDVSLAGAPFLKMNGAGNEILVLDLRGRTGAGSGGGQARALHAARDARGALAFDQLMAIRDPARAGADAAVTIFNNDGSEAGACGNGMRCVAFALTRADGRDRLVVDTRVGSLECRREGPARFTIDMGAPRLGWRDVPLAREVADTRAAPVPGAEAFGPAAFASMGNPHVVFFVADIDALDLGKIGPGIERHPMFPERANVTFAEPMTPTRVRVRTFERGVGETRACGSAACATLVSASRRGLVGRRATISPPGGDLEIEWREGDEHVLMTGPVELEFEGRIQPGWLAPA
ncbi:MAG: diaminopimelate epimerase [Hyphomicrobiales bacterium]|nr:diaminopimelate epimerase [Hyphomicrobiales bacterium]